MTVITLASLEYGVACSGDAQAYNKALLNSLLEDIRVTPFWGQAARIDQPLRAAHKERQKDMQDKLIAAHALLLGVTAVSNKEADFHGFADLSVEKWINAH
jgi:tRNA(fMet)-specific endonuclease VapC